MEEKMMQEENNIQQNMGFEEMTRMKAEARQKEKEEVEKRDIEEFGIFGTISIIYALIFVLCLYKNFSGITSPIWTAVTVGYMVCITKKLKKTWRVINTFISAVIVLLGISNFITGNEDIIFLNYVAIVCLIAANMMYLFFDMKKVNVTQHFLLLLRAALGVLIEMAAPYRQMKSFLKSRKLKKSDKFVHIIMGIVIAIPVFIVMLYILASADEVFKEVFRDLGELLSINTFVGDFIGIVIMVLIGYTVPYAFTKYISGGQLSTQEGKSAENEPIVAIIVTGVVSLLYVLFSAIQIIYLFLGKGTLPADYSYAEYAREGFFQLLFVSAFNVVMVLICIEFFKKSRILKGILVIVCGCTFVMIASSIYRMGMYIREYGLTFTRVLVLWALAVITLLMVGLVYQLFQEKFNLFRYGIIVVSVCFTLFSLSHVDYFIAKYDLNMYAEMNGMHEDDLYDGNDYVDYGYLMELSTDAAPIMAEHMEEMNQYMKENDWDLYEAQWAYQYYKEDGMEYNKITIRNFNVSRYMARLRVKKQK